MHFCLVWQFEKAYSQVLPIETRGNSGISVWEALNPVRSLRIVAGPSDGIDTDNIYWYRQVILARAGKPSLVHGEHAHVLWGLQSREEMLMSDAIDVWVQLSACKVAGIECILPV